MVSMHDAADSAIYVYPNTTWNKEIFMTWTKPAYVDYRFGFEITMYIANR